jgi:choline-sulfatase/uncharacterized sulfatase
MKYNVLMVLADQHNASLMGCAGHPQAITPNLDRFAGEAMRFTSAYTQNPICTPSRVSILSGQYCHNHGYYGLSGPAPVGLNNFMRHFRQNGYRTAALGKLHLPESPRNWIADDVDLFLDAYETADGWIARSEYFDYLEKLGLRQLEDSWHNEWNYGKTPISHDACPSKLLYEHTLEVWSAREAMKFIQQERDKPFCIKVDFQKPHHPLLPNEKFWNMYPEDIELPPTLNQNPAHRPPNFQHAFEQYRKMEWDYPAREGESFEEGARRAWRGTLACITQIDDVFGMLLDFLEKEGLKENTIIIYGSDHGAYHGIHGIEEKAPGICSEAVCRVPMIWRVPGVTPAGTTYSGFVENVDMAPTLASCCGLPPMETADGLDICPALKGGTESLREVAVTENVWSKALRWKNWRFVHYQKALFGGRDEGELYDLDHDPDETRNLYHSLEHQEIVAACRRLLLEWLIATQRVTTIHPLSECKMEVLPDPQSGKTAPVQCASGVRPPPSQPTKSTYPICSDGRAPNPSQPRFRDDHHEMYT